MSFEQTLETIALEALLEKTRVLRSQGYRLVQVSATRLPEEFEITYSYDRDGALHSLRLGLPAAAPRLPSISPIYGAAVLYENELHDLFNIQVEGMTVDFHGNLYQMAVKYPMGSAKVPSAKPAPATLSKPAIPATPASSPVAPAAAGAPAK